MTIGLKVKLLALAWSVGLLGRLIVFMLQAVGLVRVEGQEHLRELLAQDKGFLVMHRHPSMRETVIIPLLFFPSFLWSPWRVPLSAPDERNFYRPWWMAFLRPVAIPVPRGDRDGEIRALRAMHRALKKGWCLVLAPEGGRTYKGKEFKRLDSSGDTTVFPAPEEGVDLSLAVIRRFKSGVQILCNNGTPVLPVWVDSTGWHTRIIFGKPKVIPQGKNTVEALEDMLLATAPRPH